MDVIMDEYEDGRHWYRSRPRRADVVRAGAASLVMVGGVGPPKMSGKAQLWLLLTIVFLVLVDLVPGFAMACLWIALGLAALALIVAVLTYVLWLATGWLDPLEEPSK